MYVTVSKATDYGSMKVGTISYDGSRFKLEPSDSPELRAIFRHPVVSPEKRDVVTAKTDPVQYMRWLWTIGSSYDPISQVQEEAAQVQPVQQSSQPDKDSYQRHSLQTRVQVAVADTSRGPSDEQWRARNYRMGHVWINGLDITLEAVKGTKRVGWDEKDKRWESAPLSAHYGYIRRTESLADAQHIDVYLGPHPQSELVFIVNQLKANGNWDEHKVMLGFQSKQKARRCYLQHYTPRMYGGIHPLMMSELKYWLEHGDTSRPYRDDWKKKHQKTAAQKEFTLIKEELKDIKYAAQATQKAEESSLTVDRQQLYKKVQELTKQLDVLSKYNDVVAPVAPVTTIAREIQRDQWGRAVRVVKQQSDGSRLVEDVIYDEKGLIVKTTEHKE